MTKADLIEALKNIPYNAEIYLYDREYDEYWKDFQLVHEAAINDNPIGDPNLRGFYKTEQYPIVRVWVLRQVSEYSKAKQPKEE